MTLPCMWPASASTWLVPAASWRGSQSQAEVQLTPWTSSCKTGKVWAASGPMGEDGEGDRDPTLREGRIIACPLMHLQF